MIAIQTWIYSLLSIIDISEGVLVIGLGTAYGLSIDYTKLAKLEFLENANWWILIPFVIVFVFYGFYHTLSGSLGAVFDSLWKSWGGSPLSMAGTWAFDYIQISDTQAELIQFIMLWIRMIFDWGITSGYVAVGGTAGAYLTWHYVASGAIAWPIWYYIYEYIADINFQTATWVDWTYIVL